MTENNEQMQMPVEKLIAYQVARDVLQRVVASQIRDPKLRDQAIRAAQSTCLNIAEAVGRWSGPDRVRVFRIARGECCELFAALDVAGLTRGCNEEIAARARLEVGRLYALLTGLTRGS